MNQIQVESACDILVTEFDFAFNELPKANNNVVMRADLKYGYNIVQVSQKVQDKVKVAIVACGALAATACTDYLDYNQVPQSTDPTADKTLWENISEEYISV